MTKDYQIYSLEHNRAYYPYRCTVDREEDGYDAKFYKWQRGIGEENEKRKIILTNDYDNGTIKETQLQEKSKIIIPDKQFGKKLGEHGHEFGLDIKKKEDRDVYQKMILDFYDNPDEIRIGDWRGQKDEVLFYIKGTDVLIVKQSKEFITLFKGGIENERVKNARRK